MSIVLSPMAPALNPAQEPTQVSTINYFLACNSTGFELRKRTWDEASSDKEEEDTVSSSKRRRFSSSGRLPSVNQMLYGTGPDSPPWVHDILQQPTPDCSRAQTPSSFSNNGPSDTPFIPLLFAPPSPVTSLSVAAAFGFNSLPDYTGHKVIAPPNPNPKSLGYIPYRWPSSKPVHLCIATVIEQPEIIELEVHDFTEEGVESASDEEDDDEWDMVDERLQGYLHQFWVVDQTHEGGV